jgi:hypothetical protein
MASMLHELRGTHIWPSGRPEQRLRAEERGPSTNDETDVAWRDAASVANVRNETARHRVHDAQPALGAA